ncbi:hypothetical protein F3I62_11070 [Pseudomonas sp. R-28-1W-6]|uniref:hypothetical protein n=1 Tax=Pseudomonas sp. R-28-1W-6 TaxID=2650101 RepID=UPI00136551DE|nr:hypothetical protein [Pseudomonas sp. R-28-1W-6]MWV12635.1 hypothetical protein [Pseudomonas sp. R-28-1W-6]
MPNTWHWHGLSLFSLLSCAGWALASGSHALQVQDVGGTLLGGIGDALALMTLLAALAGLGLAWLPDMSGARRTWVLTFLLLGGLALYQWLGYPAEHDGNLILSPSRDELSGYALICAIALLAALPCPRRRLATPGRLRWTLDAGRGPGTEPPVQPAAVARPGSVEQPAPLRIRCRQRSAVDHLPG